MEQNSVAQSEEKCRLGRFPTVTEMEMKAIEEKRQSASTKRNTKWGMNVFKDNFKEPFLKIIKLVNKNNNCLMQMRYRAIRDIIIIVRKEYVGYLQQNEITV